jgi:hypothetical protein
VKSILEGGGRRENCGGRAAGKNHPLPRELHRTLFEERAGLMGKACQETMWPISILGGVVMEEDKSGKL